MGIDIELKIGNYETLITKWIERGATDRGFLEKVMNLLGYHAGDQYIILYDEYHSDAGYNPAEVLCNIIERYFKLPDKWDNNSVFEILLNNTKINDFLNFDGVCEKLGITLEEDEE